MFLCSRSHPSKKTRVSQSFPNIERNTCPKLLSEQRQKPQKSKHLEATPALRRFVNRCRRATPVSSWIVSLRPFSSFFSSPAFSCKKSSMDYLHKLWLMFSPKSFGIHFVRSVIENRVIVSFWQHFVCPYIYTDRARYSTA